MGCLYVEFTWGILIFGVDALRPRQQFSVMSGRFPYFLGWPNSKQRICYQFLPEISLFILLYKRYSVMIFSFLKRLLLICMIWASTWESLILLHVNNKGTDQPAHPHSLISAVVIRALESSIDKLCTLKKSRIYQSS